MIELPILNDVGIAKMQLINVAKSKSKDLVECWKCGRMFMPKGPKTWTPSDHYCGC